MPTRFVCGRLTMTSRVPGRLLPSSFANIGGPIGGQEEQTLSLLDVVAML